MKKVSTSVSTGDIVTIKGQSVRIGITKKIDGKSKIALHYTISPTSGITEWVSTRELNKLLENGGKEKQNG